MTIKTLVQDAKAKGAYTQRRAVAVAEHGKAVIVAGVEAAKTVATVAAEQLKSAAQQHKATLTDSSLPVKARVQKLRSGAGESFATLKAEVSAAATEGYRTVTNRLEHVTDMTNKEKAVEKKIHRLEKKRSKKLAAA